MKKLLPLILLLFVSCSTELNFKMPINKLMTPETTGKTLGLMGQLNYVGSEKVSLARVAGSDTILFPSTTTVSTDQGIDRSRGLGLSGNVGVSENVDVYISDSSDTSMVLGLKYQILGTSFKQRKEKSFSLAIAAGYGSGAADEGTLVIDGQEYTTELDLTTFEYMVLLGYRTTKNLMAYTSVFKATHNAEGNLKQNGISLTNGTIDGDGEMVAANLGLQFSNDDGSAYGQMEVGYGYGNYESRLKEHATTYAFSLGVGF